MLRVYEYVFCSISLLSVCMCERIPLSSRTIVGVPSSRALPGFPITAELVHAKITYIYAARRRTGMIDKLCYIAV